MKVVKKPWGQEIWIELNDRYCYKQIQINAGHRTSLQYHNEKLETNYILSGEAEVVLGDEVKKMTEGEAFTVTPTVVHRVTALTDLVMMEVSTPEVDDVVRLADDASRPDGRIESEHE